jgi:hypothetical protein
MERFAQAVTTGGFIVARISRPFRCGNLAAPA